MAIIWRRIAEKLVTILVIWLASKGLDLTSVFDSDATAEIASFVVTTTPVLGFQIWKLVKGRQVMKTMERYGMTEADAKVSVKAGTGESATAPPM